MKGTGRIVDTCYARWSFSTPSLVSLAKTSIIPNDDQSIGTGIGNLGTKCSCINRNSSIFWTRKI